MQEIKIVTAFTICDLFLENYSYYHCLKNYIFVIFWELLKLNEYPWSTANNTFLKIRTKWLTSAISTHLLENFNIELGIISKRLNNYAPKYRRRQKKDSWTYMIK